MDKRAEKRFIGTKRQMLTAVKFSHYTGNKRQVWEFLCDCGNIKIKQRSNFMTGNTNNCGCRHGLTKHAFAPDDRKQRKGIYNSWINMRQRCNNPNNPDYHFYGGRGIKVCERWQKSFKNFLDDMGLPPEGYTLDRIDNDSDYSPENCKWSSRFEQSNNRRFNKQITYKGKTQTIGQWAIELPIGITHKELYKRIVTRGWSVERAFTQPLGTKKTKSVAW